MKTKNLKILLCLLILGIHLPNISICQNSTKRQSVSFDRKLISLGSLKLEFVNITKYLPKGYDKQGKTDYTRYIQKAINENKNVVLPNFPILVTGINLLSNSNIFFQPNSKLILKPTSDTHYMIFGIIGKKNINIYNANLVGDYDKHKGTSGEWGYGIDIRGSQNIKIYNSIISNCWGDGICISSNSNKFSNGIQLLETKDITIANSLIDFNRRNGITIASGVQNIYLKNLTISNTFGVLPKAAIDIEPDHSKGKLENIVISDSKFFNNDAGVNFHINNYADVNKTNSVSVIVNNVSFKDQQSAFYFGGFAKNPNKRQLDGSIKIANVSIDRVKVPISRRNQSFGIYPQIELSNFKSNNKNLSKTVLYRGVNDDKSFNLK